MNNAPLYNALYAQNPGMMQRPMTPAQLSPQQMQQMQRPMMPAQLSPQQMQQMQQMQRPMIPPSNGYPFMPPAGMQRPMIPPNGLPQLPPQQQQLQAARQLPLQQQQGLYDLLMRMNPNRRSA
jgi:hypothetical protein